MSDKLDKDSWQRRSFHNPEQPVPIEYDYILEDRLSVLTKDQLAYAEWLVGQYTGWASFSEMCRHYPTLQPPPRGRSKANKLSRERVRHLREFYAAVTGRPAFGENISEALPR